MTGKDIHELATLSLQRYRGQLPPRALVYHPIAFKGLKIPPNAESYVARASRKVERDIYLTHVGAHMHD